MKKNILIFICLGLMLTEVNLTNVSAEETTNTEYCELISKEDFQSEEEYIEALKRCNDEKEDNISICSYPCVGHVCW